MSVFCCLRCNFILTSFSQSGGIKLYSNNIGVVSIPTNEIAVLHRERVTPMNKMEDTRVNTECGNITASTYN